MRTKSIFGSNLEFAYIFGSFATGRNKNYSDVDTFICVNEKVPEQINKYIQWIFQISELFGKIPDFIYPAEIVLIDDLKTALNILPKLTLSDSHNAPQIYDAMVWAHSLSNSKIAIINEENIQKEWLDIFPKESRRLLESFLIKRALKQYSEKESMERSIKNLLIGRNLINFLKEIPFTEESNYTEQVWSNVQKRHFFGRKHLISRGKDVLSDKAFRFGAV